MSYDFTAARAHFAAKQGFTTGPHELAGMIDRKEDVVIVDSAAGDESATKRAAEPSVGESVIRPAGHLGD